MNNVWQILRRGEKKGEMIACGIPVYIFSVLKYVEAKITRGAIVWYVRQESRYEVRGASGYVRYTRFSGVF